MKNSHHPCFIEILESRIAPANFVSASIVTYIDLDGDLVTVKSTAAEFDGAFLDFVFVPPVGSPQQLQMLNLTVAAQSISITAKPDAGGGDGFVNVGAIAAAVDLGKVTIRGDLGAITAGDGDPAAPAIKELNVHSMGRFGTTTQGIGGTLVSTIGGALGSFIVKTDVRDVEFNVTGNLGKLSIGGSFLGGGADFAGNLVVTGDISSVKIGRDLQGGEGASAGRIEATGKIGSVTIGGSVLGGDGDDSGRVVSGGAMGKVQITGALHGQGGNSSGSIHAGAKLDGVSIGWSIRGGAGDFSGRISSDVEIGAVKVKAGGVSGGDGTRSGEVYSSGPLGEVSLTGSLAGGDGLFSGRIAAIGNMAGVKVGGDVTGGSAENSGVIESEGGTIKKVTLGGSLVGGPATFTGVIFADKNIDSVKIEGDVIGGNSEVDGVDVEGTGVIRADRLPSVTIGGSLIAGSVLSATGTLTASGSIFAEQDIGKLVIKGNVIGSADLSASIIAIGQPGLAADATADLAIKSITIGGTVDRAIIDAGFGANSDAQIGTVTIGGDFIRSSIAAGVDPVNDLFGGIDDLLINEVGGLANTISSISAIIIKGQALGSPGGAGEFGFVAQKIGSLKIDKSLFTLPAGPGFLGIGVIGDLALRQV